MRGADARRVPPNPHRPLACSLPQRSWLRPWPFFSRLTVSAQTCSRPIFCRTSRNPILPNRAGARHLQGWSAW
eukprot:669898-Alexandrium_andersonii.AAC.1